MVDAGGFTQVSSISGRDEVGEALFSIVYTCTFLHNPFFFHRALLEIALPVRP